MLHEIFLELQKVQGDFIASNNGDEFESYVKTLLDSRGVNFVAKNNIATLENDSKSVIENKFKILKNQIIEKDSTELVKNPFKSLKNNYIYQPFGKQQFPDILLLIKDYAIPLEIKFSKNTSIDKKLSGKFKPMWNSNLPKANSIYIFAVSRLGLTFFKGSDILPQETRTLLLNYWNLLSEAEDFRKQIEKLENPFGFFPYIRKAYDQKKEVASYNFLSENGEHIKGIEPYFGENKTKRELSVIEFFKEIEK